MTGLTFDKRKQLQGYLMPLQRQVPQDDQQRSGCDTCQHRMAHHMQCGRGGFYVQAQGVCNEFSPCTPTVPPTKKESS